METTNLATFIGELLNYGGSLAQLALVIVFVYVFKKNGSGGKIQTTIEHMSDNHLTHIEEDLRSMNGKLDTMMTNSVVQTEILRDIRDRIKP